MSTTVRNAVEKAEKAPTVDRTIAHLIETQRDQIARALPRTGLTADRLTRVLVTECKANPQLMRCEPISLMAAVMRAAQLGLEPGPLGHCYLVPFRNGKTGQTEVTFIMGYKGLVDLARRSGQVESIYAEVVYEGDEFDYQLGLDRSLTHKRSESSNRDKVTHAYAVAKYKGGGFDFQVLDVLEINARRNRSKASSSGPWVTDYAAMARKSAVRALAPWLPLTVEAASAVEADERPWMLDDLGDVIDIAPEDDERVAIESSATESAAN